MSSRLYNVLDAIAAKHDNWALEVISINNSTNKDITIESGTRGFMFIASYGTQNACILAVGANAAGAVGHNMRVAPNNPSTMTITASTNNLNISNTSGAMLSVFYLHA